MIKNTLRLFNRMINVYYHTLEKAFKIVFFKGVLYLGIYDTGRVPIENPM